MFRGELDTLVGRTDQDNENWEKWKITDLFIERLCKQSTRSASLCSGLAGGQKKISVHSEWGLKVLQIPELSKFENDSKDQVPEGQLTVVTVSLPKHVLTSGSLSTCGSSLLFSYQLPHPKAPSPGA